MRILRATRGDGTEGTAWLVERDGVFLDLSRHLRDERATLVSLLERGLLEPGVLERELSARPLLEVEPPRTLRCPIDPREVGKVLCLGKNFRAHAEEFGEQVPDELLYFVKLPETLVPHKAEVRPPAWYGGRFDHEAELAVLIGKPGHSIPPERAFEHVAGYTVANDLTLRSLQGHDREQHWPWFRSKNFDGACPLGPALVPRDRLDLREARVRAEVRPAGSKEWLLRQDASLGDLVVDVPSAVSQLSRHLTLRAGDLVLMGTPEGVGPLSAGDEVRCSIDGIGELVTRVQRAS